MIDKHLTSEDFLAFIGLCMKWLMECCFHYGFPIVYSLVRDGNVFSLTLTWSNMNHVFQKWIRNSPRLRLNLLWRMWIEFKYSNGLWGMSESLACQHGVNVWELLDTSKETYLATLNAIDRKHLLRHLAYEAFFKQEAAELEHVSGLDPLEALRSCMGELPAAGEAELESDMTFPDDHELLEDSESEGDIE